MTPRWRTILRVRAFLNLLLEQHVPLGVLADLTERVESYSDSGLVHEYQSRMPTSELAERMMQRLLDPALGLAGAPLDPLVLDPLMHDDAERPAQTLLRAARDELRLVLNKLHKFDPWDATADANRIADLILRLDIALGVGRKEAPA